MKPIARLITAVLLATVLGASASGQNPAVDWDTVAKIREEGLQRSQVMDIVGYMTDVLGARLTLSEGMTRAQAWAKTKMEALGLENVAIEPFMDYGAAWDNEYFSLHMLEPEYQPMMGFPLAYTSGTKGKVAAPAVIASDIQTKKDLDRYRGKLKGAVVLSTPPLALDMAALTQGVSRLTDAELKQMEETVLPRPQRTPPPPPVPNPDLLKAEDRLEFFRAEGAVAVLQCEGGQPGMVRGFSRPGANEDKWSREKTLRTLPLIAVTPEHYNRMVPHPQAGHPGQGRGRGPQPRRREGREGLERRRRDPGDRPPRRGRHARRPLRQLARRRRARATPPRAAPSRSRPRASSRRSARSPAARSGSPSGAARSRASTARASTSAPTSATRTTPRSAPSRPTRNSRSTSTRTTAPASSAASTFRATSASGACSQPGWSRSATSG